MKIIFLKKGVSVLMILISDPEHIAAKPTAFFWEAKLYFHKNKITRGLRFEKTVKHNVWDTFQKYQLKGIGYKRIKANRLFKMQQEQSLPFTPKQFQIHEFSNFQI